MRCLLLRTASRGGGLRVRPGLRQGELLLPQSEKSLRDTVVSQGSSLT